MEGCVNGRGGQEREQEEGRGVEADGSLNTGGGGFFSFFASWLSVTTSSAWLPLSCCRNKMVRGLSLGVGGWTDRPEPV